MTKMETKPQVILHRSDNSHYGDTIRSLKAQGLSFHEAAYLAELPDKSFLSEVSLAVAIVDGKADGIDFLRSVMHFDHLIQRIMLSDVTDHRIFELAINKAHINYYLSLPLEGDKFSECMKKAAKRHHDLTRPFQQLQMLSEITRELFSDKEKFRQEALTDSLTGLLNRRAFSSLLNTFFSRKNDPEQAVPFTLAMLDLDHFKKINDRYGHVGGDAVLKFFGRQLAANLRGGVDQAFRYGGEEFAILSFHSTTGDMKKLLERLLERVRSTTVEFENRRIPFTFSAGVAHSDEADLPEHLIDLADEQLYRAKSAGRNQICIKES